MVTIGQYGGDKIDVTALVKYAQSLEAEIERMRAERLKLDRRIHNQRRANRDTWETVEMRRKWMGSAVARRMYGDLLKRHRALLAQVRANGQGPSE